MQKADPSGSIYFDLGQVVATPRALNALAAVNTMPETLLRRHQRGDWGDVSAPDAKSNELALRQGSRLLSSYHLSSVVKVWVITEADRSVTTLLLPSEY